MSYRPFVPFRALAARLLAPVCSGPKKKGQGVSFAAGALFALAAVLAGPALATTTINHQFAPATINSGDVSKYRITVSNDDTGSALSNTRVTVILQPEITVSSLAGVVNTCGFTVNQPTTTGGHTVELVNGTIPIGGASPSQCYFEIDVTSIVPGNWINTIPANLITGAAPGTPSITPDATHMGYLATTTTTGVPVANTTAADATLAVNSLSPPSGTKSFSPSPAYAGNPVTLTITLANPNTAATMPLTSFTDLLPDDGAGGHAMLVNGTPGVVCTGTGKVDGSVAVAADNKSITLSGATIGYTGTGTGVCTISVPVVVAGISGTSQAFNNTLADGAIGNVRGLTSLAFSKSLTVQTPISIAKSFSASTIPAGQPSLMTLTISNHSSVNSLDISAFSDNLTGTTLQVLTTASSPVVAPADPAISCTGSGAANGTLTTVADTLDTTLSLVDAIAGPNGACTITAYVTSYVDGAHPNTTSKVTNPTHNYDSTPASASLTAVAQLRVTKSVSVDKVAPGQWTEFTVTIKNYTGGIVSNVLFKDLLPSNGVNQMVVFDPATSGIYVTDAGCSGGTWTGLNTSGVGGTSTGSVPVSGADAGLQWSGGSIVAGSGASPGVCTIKIRAQLPATATTGMTFTNTIAQDSITGEKPDHTTVTNPDTTGSSAVTTIDAVAVSKGFAPASMAQGGLSTLTINIDNRVVTPNSPISLVNLSDNLPSGVFLAANPAPTNTCGGTLEAFPGGTRVKLSGGTFAVRPDASQQASCKITVQVTASALGTYTNTITPSDFSSSAGTIPANATAPLAVTAGITGSKSFSPSAVTPGGTARVTITVNNTDSGLLTNLSIDDDNFGGLVVANPANAASSCAGSPTLVVNPGQARAQLLGATLNAGASCTFSFDVSASGAGPWTNTVPVGKVSSAEGLSNTAALSATLNVNTASIGINKSFLTPLVTGGVPSVLQIDIISTASVAIHNVSFTDTFPLGIQVYSVPSASTTCAGGTVTAVPGDGKIVLSGATLAANATCRVYVTTTSVKFLNLTNTIPAFSVSSAEGYTNPLPTAASLSTLQGLGVMKGFAPAYIATNGISRLKVTLVSTFDPNAVTPTNLTGVSFTDALPNGVTLAGTPNASTTCSNGSGGAASLTLASDKKSLTLSGATITPGSLCVIEADVTASALGAYDNTILKDGVTSTQGVTNQTPATARLNVVTQPTIAKAFSVSPVQIGVPSKLTVTISNGSGVALSGVSLVDTLPTGLTIANTPNAATSCSNGVVSANVGDAVVRLTGATLAIGASCTFSADVISGAAGSYANNIAAGKLVDDQGLSNPGPASATLVVVPPAAVSKRFSPASIAVNGTSTLTITLSNSSASAITLTADLVDALPGNVLVANPTNVGGTCVGTKTAVVGGSTLMLASGATIPAAGSCTLTVDVTSSVGGSYINVIAAGQMKTSAGNNQDPAIATLGVGVLAPPTLAKAFSPATIFVGGTSTLTITLGNDNISALTLSSALTDNLPTNIVVAATPAIGGTCTGLVTAAAAASSIAYASGAKIPAGGCTIAVDVTSLVAASYTNIIATTALLTDGGSPPLPAEAGLVVKSLTPPGVRKSFSPGTINPGGVSTLTINLDNDNASDLTLASVFTDTLPTNIVVAATPAIGGSCTGLVTAAAAGSSITYASGATIPAGGCLITVDVTSSLPGGPYTNTIAAGALVTTEAGSNGAAAVANLFVTPFQPPSVSKSFSAALLPKNATSTLTLSLANGNAAAVSLTADFVDTLPGSVVVATPSGLATSVGCESAKVLAPAGGTTVTYQSGASLAGNGGCTIQVNVTSTTATAALTNSIGSGALKTGAGNNAVGATAPIQFVDWPVASDLALTKAIAPGTGAAGDTQTVTLTWRNANAASPTKNLYQCVISDPLPTAAFDLAANNPVSTLTPSGYTFSFNTGTNTVIYTRDSTSTPCETTLQTATFTVPLKAGVVTGSTYTNTATLTAKTLPSNAPVSVDPLSTLTKTASANVVVGAPTTSGKTVVSTSQTFTPDTSLNANPLVAIGEMVTYSIPFNLPPGVTNAVTLADEITTGIGDVTLVSAMLARSSTSLSAANDLAAINAATVNVPVDVTASSVMAGNEFRFALGNVSNSGAAATYTLTMTLRIADVPANTAGHKITDQGRFRYQNASAVDVSVTTATKDVHVGLPGITLSKTVAPAAPNAGDTVTYTLTLTNPASNAVAGFDVAFSDTLPADLGSPTAPAFNVGTTGASGSGSFTGNLLSGSIDRLDPGETVTVTYTAQVNTATPFGKTIVNSASAQITTLPGTDANERTISSSAATATLLTSTPSITKTLVAAQTRYAIGDKVAYRVTVNLPVGTTTNFTVRDTLPAGLAYVPGSATLSLVGVSGPTAGAITPTSSAPLTFSLGTLTVNPAGSITLDYLAQVSNLSSNQDGTPLVNSAQATYDKPGGGTNTISVASPPSITVGEPNFTMSKAIVSGATGAQAGSVVRWSVTAQNTGTVTAYQASVVDALPPGLGSIANVSVIPSGGNILLNNAGCTPGTAVSAAQAVLTKTVNTNDTLTLAGLCFAPNATLTVAFDSTVLSSVSTNQVLNNVVRGSYASQPTGTSSSAATVVRDGADSPTDDDTDPVGTCNGSSVLCNNYNESASKSLTIGAPIAIDKQASATSATIGQELTYSIKVNLIQGITPAVIVEDTLPAGLSYVSHTINVGNSGIKPANPAYATRLGSGQTVRFDFGNVQNDANGISTDDWLNIDLTVRVDNLVAHQAGTVLKNGEGGTVTVQYGSVPTTVIYDYDSATPGNQGRPLTLTEPVLTATKAVVPTTQSLGDLVTYTLTLQHTGASTADALDVLLTDTLATGLVFVPGSVTPSNAYVGIAGQVLSLRVDPSDPLTRTKNSTTISYQARIAPSAAVSTPLANTVLGSYASTVGATGAATSGRNGSGGLNDYTLAASATVTPNQSAAIYSTKTVTQVTDPNNNSLLEAGEQIEYTVLLSNTTATPLSNVVFTDTLPAQTTLVAGTLNSTLGTVNAAGAPNLVVNIPTLAANATATIRFRAQVNAGVPTGTVISNQGLVDSDQTVPKPTDADGNPANGDQPTTIRVGGSGPGALYASKFVSLLTDADNNGAITAGDTLRYALIVKNTGGTTLANVVLTDPIPAGLTASGTPSASQGSIAASAGTVTWTIGALLAGQTVTAYFDVTIAAFSGSQTFSNQGSVSADSVSTVQTDGNGNPVDGAQPTVFEAGSGVPILDVQKRWALAVDTAPFGVTSPGDTLQYTITVANTGSAPATNVRLSDPLPACSGILALCTAYVSGSLTTSQGAVVSESPQDVNLGTLAPGGFVTLSYSVRVDPASANGVVIANQASVTRTGSSSPVLSDDNGNPADGIHPTLTPISTVAGGSGYPSALAKQLVGSSEATSIGAAVLIGEVLRYRISVTLPKGTARQVGFADVLPAGLAYLPGSARLARTFDTGLLASANPAGINSAASGTSVTLVDGTSISVGSGAGGTGTLDVFLGDVINSDADSTTPEMYTLEYRALVLNDAGNQAGTSLANAATVRFWNALGQSQSLTPVTATQIVSEPAITLSKAAAPASLLTTGGTTQYTLNIANPAGANVAPAFDLVLSDVLPAAFTSVGARNITSSGASAVVDTTSGTTVGLTIARLDPGGSVSVEFSAVAPGPVLAAVPIVNNANLTWSSLPGSNGSAADGVATPGIAGSATGERIGTGGVNDYTAAAAATVTVPINGVAIAKSLVNAQARYAIGDPVSYRIDFTVPGAAYGPVPDLAVSDILAPGLTYVPGSLVVVYNGVTASTPPSDFVRTDNTPGAGQETLLATFGTLTNVNAGGTTVTLTYRALVDNLLANQANTTLVNKASLAFTDTGSGSVSTTRGPVSTSITVGEPFLTLSKTLTSGALGLLAGNPVSFSVTVGNTGTLTAFETVLSDTLPGGLYFPAGSTVSVIASNLSGHLQVPTVSVSTGAWQTSAFDLPVGDSVTFTFTATLGTSVQPGQTLQNSVLATYTSRDGTDANERNGTSSGALQTDDTQLNNYHLAASAAPLTVADPIAIAKAFYPNAALNRYVVGQLVTYRLTLSVLEGTTRSVRIFDTLPVGLSFVSAGSPGSTPGAPISFNYSGSPTVTGQVVSFDLGNVVDTPNGNAADDFITIDLTARVDNLLANQEGTLLGNHLSVSFVDAASVAHTRDFDANAGMPGVQPLTLTVIEPVLALTKSVTPTTQSLGDGVTFTLNLAHTAASHADAYDVAVVDMLPAGLAFVPGSVNPPGLFAGIVGQTLNLNVGTLTQAGASRTVTYQARVSESAPPGVAQTNTARATWGSISGATGSAVSGRNGSNGSAGLNDYSVVASAALTPNNNAQIDAHKTVAMVVDADKSGSLSSGDTLEWTIVLTNSGKPVTGVVFSDGIPANTTLVAGSLYASKGTALEAPLPLTVTVGAMAAAEVVTIRFRTLVNAGLAPGTLLSNQGSVDSDQTVPTLTDADVNPANGQQPTTIAVNGQPDLTIAKHHSGNFTRGQVGATYSVTVSNSGSGDKTASHTVTVTDSAPTGLTITAMSGTGWTCSVLPSCTRSDALAAGSSYPAITVTVSVAADAGTPLVNSVAVSLTGQTESNNGNNSATDPTTIATVALALPDLTISKHHSGNFTQGQIGAQWTLLVSNIGAGPTTAAVNLTDKLPSGVTATALSGTGWSCTLSPLACSRHDALPAGASWPPLSLLVNIDPALPAGTLINTATVAGGGETLTGNNTAVDSVLLQAKALLAPPSVTKTVRPIEPGVVEWRMVVINSANTKALLIRLNDPNPPGLSYIPGSLSCQPTGGTTLIACAFNTATASVVVDARLGPDAGHFDAVAANNELVVTFRSQTNGLVGAATNVVSVFWDAKNMGAVGNDPSQVALTASAVYGVNTTGVPIDAPWMLAFLALLLAGFAYGTLNGRQPGRRN